MECNRRRSGTTVAHRWRAWIDPRLPILVLDSGDLNEVTWEQREMEGDPKFAASQTVPQVPYADYAQALGLGATKLRAPPRWDRRGMRPWRPIGHHHQEEARNDGALDEQHETDHDGYDRHEPAEK